MCYLNSMFVLKRIIVLLVFFLASSFTHAQNFLVEHYTTENGLPQNSIKNIHLDKLGFLWLITEDGLVRFNGKKFTTFNKSNLPFISQNRFSAIHYTNDENTVYVTNIERLAFKIVNGKINIDTTARYIQDLKLPMLIRIDVAYWVKAYGESLKTIQGSLSDSFLTIQSYPVTDSTFSVWGNNEIRLFTKERLLKRFKVPSNIVPKSFFTLGKKQFLVTRKAEIYWINYYQNKIEKVKITKELQAFQKNLKPETFECFQKLHYKNVFVQNKDLLYKLTYNNSDGSIGLTQIANNVPLSSGKEFDISPDEKTIFFGTLTDGLFILKKNDFDVWIPDGNQLNEYSFYGLLPLNKNSAITSNGYILSSNKKHLKAFSVDLDKRYLANFNNKIYYYKNGIICKYKQGKTTEVKMPTWLKYAGPLLTNKTGDFIWVAYGNGIAKLNANDSFEKVFETDIIDTTAIFPTYCLFEDSINSMLYLGTSNSIVTFNGKTKKIERIKELAGKRIRALIVIDNILFIGTEGDGYYIKYKQKIIQMPLDDLKYLSSVHCFVKDNFDRIWMPTNKGLFAVKLSNLISYSKNDIQTVYYYSYNKENGIKNNEFNGGCQPCAAVMQNETILFPTMQGVVSFNPAKIEFPSYSSTIIFDRVITDTTNTNFSTLSFKGKLSQYMFYWSSPAWYSEVRTYFEYNLVGLDTSWKKIEPESPIFLSNLEKGDYTLQIRQKMPAGDFSIAKLPFNIMAKWYETLWFYVCLALIFCGVLYGLFKFNAKQIIKKNVSLEKMIASRTSELTKTNDKLLAEVELKNKIVAIISHDMISPLNFSNQVTQNLLNRKPIVEKNELLQAIDVLNTTNGSLYLMALNTLKLINSKKVTPVFDTFNLYEVVQNKIALYQPAQKNKPITFLNRIPKNTVLYNDSNLIGLAIQNIINNAVKFTPQGSIIIDGTPLISNKYQIIIKDTGVGISQATLDELNKHGQDIVDYSTNQKMGWLIIKDILQILNANYQVKSGENEGTEVIIVL